MTNQHNSSDINAMDSEVIYKFLKNKIINNIVDSSSISIMEIDKLINLNKSESIKKESQELKSAYANLRNLHCVSFSEMPEDVILLVKKYLSITTGIQQEVFANLGKQNSINDNIDNEIDYLKEVNEEKASKILTGKSHLFFTVLFAAVVFGMAFFYAEKFESIERNKQVDITASPFSPINQNSDKALKNPELILEKHVK